ncbi:hypothetical protein PSTG_14360 [Puccinia striiformis f. sp. tritici PST-78]|uniref:Uncharacterized protein n=1 Tax=Puccinia striiformis f. sp. tritici PST-78 TaxID=1165861 RepID=A0A0L0UZC1_9BASI|nr:hypothetical protein PSTG_14360 [Puccinia striiformis f. sp. tritici PST-78]
MEGLKLFDDDCLLLQLQGISEQKIVLLTSTQSPQIQDSIKKWEPGTIYAIKALSSLAKKFYDIIGPSLADAFARPIHNDPSCLETNPGALLDLEQSVRVSEAMVQVIQHAVDRLLPSLLLVLSSSLPSAIPLKPSTLSILTICLESAPGTLTPSLLSLWERIRYTSSIKVLSTDPLSSLIQSQIKSSGTNQSDVEKESQTEEEEEDNHNLIPPITSQIHSDHHHKTLIQSALLFIQTLLNQTLSLSHSSSSSYGDQMVLPNIQVSIRTPNQQHSLASFLSNLTLTSNTIAQNQLPQLGSLTAPPKHTAGKFGHTITDHCHIIAELHTIAEQHIIAGFRPSPPIIANLTFTSDHQSLVFVHHHQSSFNSTMAEDIAISVPSSNPAPWVLPPLKLVMGKQRRIQVANETGSPRGSHCQMNTPININKAEADKNSTYRKANVTMATPSCITFFLYKLTSFHCTGWSSKGTHKSVPLMLSTCSIPPCTVSMQIDTISVNQ